VLSGSFFIDNVSDFCLSSPGFEAIVDVNESANVFHWSPHRDVVGFVSKSTGDFYTALGKAIVQQTILNTIQTLTSENQRLM